MSIAGPLPYEACTEQLAIAMCAWLTSSSHPFGHTGLTYVAQASFGFIIFLALIPDWWDFRQKNHHAQQSNNIVKFSIQPYFLKPVSYEINSSQWKEIILYTDSL